MLCINQLQVTADPWSDHPLIAGLSLTVNPGEAMGVTGPSGCGKSTLLRSIAGLIDPVGGAVTLGGKTPDEVGWPNFRSRVCLVPQRPVVWEESVVSNLQRPFAFGSVGQTFDPGDAEGMLEHVGLIDMPGAQATTLSEGERQRVCLVRALIAQPGFILLDEPTSALDGDAVRWVEALLAREMAERNLGVLIATHDREQAERLCSRVIDLSAFIPGREAVADA